jgi:hypothetical protein
MDVTVLVTGSESQRNGMECCNGAEREREREIGGERGGTIKSEPSVCRRLQGLQDYNKGQAKQTGELSFAVVIESERSSIGLDRNSERRRRKVGIAA